MGDRDSGDLDKRLRRERPEPRDAFVSDLVRRVRAEPIRRRTGIRIAVAAGFTALLVVAFALTGGVGYAAKSVQGGTTAVTDLVAGPSNDSHPNNGNQGNGTGNANGNVNANGNDTGPPSGNGNPCAPGTHSDGTSCVPNGDSGGNCGQNQGNGQGGNDNGFGNDATCNGGSGGDQYEEKTLICHSTGSETNPWIIISVSNNALPAHQAHGDTLVAKDGTCPGDPIVLP